MGDTTIEWTEKTWNPVRGCRMISPGCANCYAMKQAGRMSGAGGAYGGLVKLRPGKGFVWTGDFRQVPNALDVPLRVRAPTTWFVNSMSDLFGEGVSDEYIAAVFGVMAAAPRHTFQLLTKRAERLLVWFEWLAAEPTRLVQGMERSGVQEVSQAFGALRMTCAPRSLWSTPWPLPNVWLGVSVEDRKHGLPRIEHLRRTPAAVRFLSIEPLLEDLGEIDLAGIHWVIVGGESGPGARPFDLAWARSIRDQCKAAGVPYFFKQAGARPYDSTIAWKMLGKKEPVDARHAFDLAAFAFQDKKGGDLAELPADLRIREMPEVRRG